MLYDKRWETEPVEIPAIKPKPRAKPKPLNWRQILLKAATIIEERGWCRNGYQRSGHYCALGAMNKAAGFMPSGPLSQPVMRYQQTRQVRELVLAKEHLMIAVGSDVAGWNDNRSTDKQEVIETLRKIAKAEEF